MQEWAITEARQTRPHGRLHVGQRRGPRRISANSKMLRPGLRRAGEAANRPRSLDGAPPSVLGARGPRAYGHCGRNPPRRAIELVASAATDHAGRTDDDQPLRMRPLVHPVHVRENGWRMAVFGAPVTCVDWMDERALA